jgi:excisionase family DNA binding protein
VSITSDAVASRPAADERLLTPAEVAALFRVDPKTAGRWAKQRKMGAIKTPGGRWRFPESQVRQALAGDTEPSS